MERISDEPFLLLPKDGPSHVSVMPRGAGHHEPGTLAATIFRLNDRLQEVEVLLRLFPLRIRGDVLAVVQVVHEGFVGVEAGRNAANGSNPEGGFCDGGEFARLQAWRENQALGVFENISFLRSLMKSLPKSAASFLLYRSCRSMTRSEVPTEGKC